jgi:hypothetical protein
LIGLIRLIRLIGFALSSRSGSLYALCPRVARIVLALLLLPSLAWADEVRCRSRDYRYAFCSTRQPIVSVRVRKRHSDRPCVQGQSWGYQRQGIWVNHGCDAEFEAFYRGMRPPGNGGDWGWGGWEPPPGAVPSWAVGQFRSDERQNNRFTYLTVYPGGAVNWNGPQGAYRGVWQSGDIVLYGGPRLDVDRQGFMSQTIRVRLPNGSRLRFRRIG